MKCILLVSLVAAVTVSTTFRLDAAPVEIDDEADRRIVDAFLEHTRRVPTRVSAEHCREMAAEKVEGITWEILPYLKMPLVAYELTGDADYLDIFVAAFGNLRAAMTEGPDGYLGWYGTALPIFRDPDDPDKAVDVLINSFRAVELLSEFVEHVDADPTLRRRFGEPREQYLDLTTNHLVRKWTERGNYVDLGDAGAIYRTHFGLKAEKGNLTQPSNKLSIITHGLLALHRATGDDQYMTMAVKLGTHFKHRLTLGDGFYTWNYWDPAGGWDVHPDESGRWKHWIGAEHRAGYYGHSVAFVVELYHHGVVFDEQDIERLLRTQMTQAWNGDVENPTFHRVDRSTGKQSGDYVSGALAPWNETLAGFLYEGERKQARLASASHAWQGGPTAAGWVRGKFVTLPAATSTDDHRLHAAVGERYRQNADNRALLESLMFDVTDGGYQPPRTPRDWPDMPADPGRGEQ